MPNPEFKFENPTLHEIIADELSAVMPKLQDEEQAYKKAVIKMAVEATLEKFPELHEQYGVK